MRYHEISSGYRIPVSSEEKALIDRVLDKPVSEDDLSEREGQLAFEMTKRGLLKKFERDGKAYVEADRLDLWRI